MSKMDEIKRMTDKVRTDNSTDKSGHTQVKKYDPVAEALAMHKNEGKRKRVTAHRKNNKGKTYDKRMLIKEVEHTRNVIKRGNMPHHESHKLGSVDNSIAYTSYEMFNRDYEMGKFDIEKYRGTGVKPKSSGRKAKPSGYTGTIERGNLRETSIVDYDPHANMDEQKEETEVKQELK